LSDNKKSSPFIELLFSNIQKLGYSLRNDLTGLLVAALSDW